MNIVNSYADSIEACHIGWEELIQAYPELKDWTEPTEGPMQITTSVHCECTIAVHMLRIFQRIDQRTRPTFVEIGISKHSCWLCQKYLEFLSAWRLWFVIAGFQGKIHPGWRPPPSGPPNTLSRMVGLLRQEMDEILESVNRKRRSDSYPRESNPENAILSEEIEPSLVRKWFPS